MTVFAGCNQNISFPRRAQARDGAYPYAMVVITELEYLRDIASEIWDEFYC